MLRLVAVWLLFACGLRAVSAEFLVSKEMVAEVFRGERTAIELPTLSGSREVFQLRPGSFVPFTPEYPIKTFRGRGSRNSASLVITPQSISAQIFGSGSVVYVNSRPVNEATLQLEIAEGDDRSASNYQCLTPLTDLPPAPSPAQQSPLRQQSAKHVLREFRLAAGATAEFSEYFGSKEEAVRQVVTAMSRANEIFYRELGITFRLVPGFERMIFTDKTTDPFTSNEPSPDLLNQTQGAFDSLIGTENYDVGIVLTRGAYGLAAIRGVCHPQYKGSSCIGLPEPAGDAFHVNLVTHELGHQFGATHTFNSPSGICAERRNEWAAFEPGAGSTIMSYSSLPCGGDSFQSWHDAYFHSQSLKEIRDFINSAAVTCAVLTPSENSPPSVAAGPEYTIPVGTPFVLTASGSDPDGDEITYCWEEWDLGPAQTLGAPDNGLSPRFRSQPPSASPTRIFPALEKVLAGSDSPEERLPQTNRYLGFRVVVRDSHDDGAIGWGDTQLQVVNIAGPFRIRSHATAQTLQGSTRLEWSTGGTEGAPIFATQVRITLSTNGGLSFPIVLAASTPNDGEEIVVLPQIKAADARLKIEPTNNIFFDINDAPLTIATSPTGAPKLELTRAEAGKFLVSWPAVAGTRYRLERAEVLQSAEWREVLTTNAASSSVSVTLSPSADAGYYRLIQP
jgi:hypothetical protein